MGLLLKNLIIDNFKSYSVRQTIDISDVSAFVGANSSGKSTAMQALLVLKQTMECNSPDIDLLLCGKYVNLGNFDDVLSDKNKQSFSFGIVAYDDEQNETTSLTDQYEIIWEFHKKGMNDENAANCLNEVRFCCGSQDIRFKSRRNNLFNIWINSKFTPLLCTFDNLKSGQMHLCYDVSFNKMFKSFLDEVMLAIFKEEKSIRINGDKLVAFEGVNQFYSSLLRSTDSRRTHRDEDSESLTKICNDVLALIDDFCAFQCDFYKRFKMFPVSFLRASLCEVVLRKSVEGLLTDICRKYRQKFEDYKISNVKISDWSGITKIPDSRFYYTAEGEDKNRPDDYTQTQQALEIYRNFEKDIVNRIFFLGPIRENPNSLYNIGFETIPKYVGPTGIYFASVLYHQNQNKCFLLPYGKEECSLWEALDEWAAHLKIASGISVETNNSFGFSVSVSNEQNKKADIMNVGIGTSQVLPVLIIGLLSEEGEVLMFEQPELHLHPYSQSRLADFFVALAKNGRKIIIETHSEYFLLRLRYHVLKGIVAPEKIAVNFFQNKDGTEVTRGRLTEYGNLEYPDDFHDETQELINDLMNAMLTKRNK